MKYLTKFNNYWNLDGSENCKIYCKHKIKFITQTKKKSK